MTAGLRHTALSACLALGVADLVLLNTRLLPRALGRGFSVAASVPAAAPAPLPAVAPLTRAEPAVPAARVNAPASPVPEVVTPAARVTFETGLYRLDRHARQAVDALAARLARRRGLTILVEGHADQRGVEALNNPLSRRRAEAVAARLAARGVEARIAIHALGAARPLSDHLDPVSLRRNRRVEIIVRGGSS
jgi:outer membrane protein OmpA-like peptidoglycan-associated protein